MNEVRMIGRVNKENNKIEVVRESGYIDCIPVNLHANHSGERVCVCGVFKSLNKRDGDKVHVELYVDADKVTFAQDKTDYNDICISGNITKKPVIRATPKGRVITEIMLAVHGEKTYFIPCICWGETAIKALTYRVGESVTVAGRIQSREYNKGVAYEVSATYID